MSVVAEGARVGREARSRAHVLALLVVAMSAQAAHAGEAPDEIAPDATPTPTAPSTEPTPTPVPDEMPAPSAPPSSTTPSGASLAEPEALGVLRTLEGKLSVGAPLTDGETQTLFLLLRSGATPRVRATAAGVMAWLTGDEATEALSAALIDDDAGVRGQAAAGILALLPKASTPARLTIAERARALMHGPSDEAACHGVRVYAALVDAEAARAAALERQDEWSDVRHGCFREVTGIEGREISVARPTLPRALAGAPSPASSTTSDPLGGVGTGLFIATSAAAGAVAGGFIVPALVPARDTLTYTRRTTKHTREEPSIALTVALGLASSAAFGGAAYGVSWLVDGVAFAPAASTTMMTVAGGAFGFGLGLSLNLDQPLAGASLITSTVGGLLVGSTMSLVLPPTTHDLTLIGSTAGAFALFGTLLTYTIVPVGYPTVLFGAKRNDFAVGVGLVSGALGAMGALVASPVLDFSYGRLLAASGTALAATMTGLAASYLLTPVNLDIRSRIAAGVGTAFGVASGLLVFVLLPSSWADVLERVDVEVGREALVVDEGEVKIGLPSIDIRPSDPIVGTKTGTQFSIGLLGGHF